MGGILLYRYNTKGTFYVHVQWLPLTHLEKMIYVIHSQYHNEEPMHAPRINPSPEDIPTTIEMNGVHEYEEINN